MNVRITRSPSTPEGTFGVLSINGARICVTCEDPWRDNQHNISCIPKGTYSCIPHDSQKFPQVWEVTGVPDRGAILIHAGNTMLDTHGCILVGESYGNIGGLPAVLNSRSALNKLRNLLPEVFELEIA